MNKKYQCNICANFFATIIDLNYHWFDCGNKNQEDKDYEWLEENNFNSSKKYSSQKTKLQPQQNPKKEIIKKLTNDISLSNISLVNCPNCNSMIRKDRLQRHIERIHLSVPTEKFKSKSFLSEKIKNRVPMPKLLAEKEIKSEKKKNITKFTNQNKQPEKTSPKIKTISIETKCSCEGENENCFKCNGTGFYKRKMVTNIDECQDRVQEKRIYKTNSTQESQFSNDQRGGIYGIREQGRFSSNPLHEEDF